MLQHIAAVDGDADARTWLTTYNHAATAATAHIRDSLRSISSVA